MPMKQVPLLFMFLIAPPALFGCVGDSALTPTSTVPDTATTGEFTATVVIDTCWFLLLPSSGELDSLCGESSIVNVSFEFVYPDETSEYNFGDVTIRTRTVRTGPGSWEFSNPMFSSAMLSRFSGLPLRIEAHRIVSPTYDSRGIVVAATWIQGSESYGMKLVGPYEMPVDADGVPVLENRITLTGVFQIQHYSSSNYEIAFGKADVEINNLREAPVDSMLAEALSPASNWPLLLTAPGGGEEK